MNIALSITDDYEERLDEFEDATEACEWLLEQVQEVATHHEQFNAQDTYTFADNSQITFKGNYYRVGGVEMYYIKLYQDYINNFLTIECFAEYWELDLEEAKRIIKFGKEMVEG